MTCSVCGGPQRHRTARRCQACYRKEMTERNRRDAPTRMRERNPMRLQDNRAKMAATLKRIRHSPPFRGGNGRPIPEPQRLLADALGWVVEYALPTKAGNRNGIYPNHYKLDIANLERRICIEVDGWSHCAIERRNQDAKKMEFLEARGWIVLRFTNQEVLTDVERCADVARRVRP